MDFLQFAAIHGLDIRRLDHGKISRCPTKEHPRKDNGAYLFDGQWGWVQDWSTMLEPAYWTDETITKPEDLAALRARMEASRKQHARERAKDAQNAAQKAKAIIKQARIEQHAYLDAHNMRERVGIVYYPNECTNLLVIPMAVNGDICGCQLIDRNGSKRFLKGQRTSGAEHVLGSVGIDVWVEGFCTGVAVQTALQAIKLPAKVHVTFSAGNLKNMAMRGVIIADHDKSKAGESAALETGLPFYLPEIEGDDFCDEWARIGTFKAGMRLREFIQKRIARA